MSFALAWQDCLVVAGYLAIFEGRIPNNLVPQAPHLAIKAGAMGWGAEPPTSEQMAAMTKGLEEWLEAGAVGMAAGLEYQPCALSTVDELVALCEDQPHVLGMLGKSGLRGEVASDHTISFGFHRAGKCRPGPEDVQRPACIDAAGPGKQQPLCQHGAIQSQDQVDDQLHSRRREPVADVKSLPRKDGQYCVTARSYFIGSAGHNDHFAAANFSQGGSSTFYSGSIGVWR